MNPDRTVDAVDELWDASAVPSLLDYVRIPNLSPAFDPDWSTNGLIDRAADHVAAWCRAEAPPGASVEVLRLEGRTPVVVVEVDGGAPGTVLVYGHLDKQPPMLPWGEGLHPYEPVIRDGLLFGRGAADDGYSAYAAIGALRSLVAEDRDFGRCIVLIEGSEESGSPDLPAYLEHLAARLGSVDLVICLDSGCGDYERPWITTSLRGTVGVVVTAEVLSEAVHSGDAGGIVPDSFAVLRALLDRIEDPATGQVRLRSARVEIPPERRRQAAEAAECLRAGVITRFPFVGDTASLEQDPTEAILARTWRPALAVHGADGLPPVDEAGAVLRRSTTLKLSVRIPPTADPDEVVAELVSALTTDPPHGARVSCEIGFRAPGWEAPSPAPWLSRSLADSADRHFGTRSLAMGEGGSIPFMAMLGRRFPEAQFVVTGVLGPHSNAHGPNELLDLAYAKALTRFVGDVIGAHALGA